ncbi:MULTISPECIES: flagellar basal body-associated protein FliL [Shewanella]|uniref:Flagellar protein FliL n=1 Tax=Shewanella oneidensis (strain ATCC 700550 / JCM 31522 / CIP 106686 / LMG 19005 / NCIMB 14063 / MR-1) TaxID=211586 RepID=Q8EKG1_SHEON|nr:MULTISPECIES: flagellar basal body-associated protein FliL [Shewanella]AAN53219.1 periplasmic FliL-like protein [Shewanella oneidensis MR-1]MDI5836284.1 flagellar basal body-associated protein FliL [Shewanella xiamenensis]MDI5840263.1 flagellar basal body-associated protein FliL [Shewanella xiamenensis]MDI5844180.1 flagellar basal body-associated protein FliL [Shewanella xiamenensis]MDI5847236.1 flagellar basal body-associated protein FliL [Shewanella xiamenensis]
MKKLLSACLILFTVVCSAYAADEKEAAPAAEYAYYGFEPEIVTNYISNRKKLGFVKISVELMVKSPDDLVIVERHDPLLRAAIIEVLGNQAEEKVKSLTGREEIRRECFDMVNNLLTKEAGKPLVVNLLFTSYLYD